MIKYFLKLFVQIFIPFLLVFTIYTAFSHEKAVNNAEKSYKEILKTYWLLVSNYNLENQNQVSSVLKAIDNKSDIRITLIDKQGNVILDSSVNEKDTLSLENHLSRVEVQNALLGSEYYDIRIPSYIEPKNPSVKWQKKQDRSVEIDLALFNYRIRATVNYYNNVTRNLLDQKTLPISVGVNSIKCNTSSIKNWGWELSLSTRNIQMADFTWNTSLNLSVNKNKVLESYYKSIEDVPVSIDMTEPIEGEEIRAWFGYRFAGIDPRTGHTLAFVDNSKRDNPIGFQREDGKWVLDMDDVYNSDTENIKENLGKSYPMISGGFSTNFTYKRLSLEANFSFMTGHKITAAYYASAAGGSVASASQNVLRKEASRWRKPGDITDVPAYSTDEYPSLRSNWYDLKLENGNFLKCTGISLGYYIPTHLCEKVLLQSLRVNFNIRDVFTITRYSGLDPENFGGFGYPNSRKYMVSLSIGI